MCGEKIHPKEHANPLITAVLINETTIITNEPAFGTQ
jgi:hypothetical protein